MRNFANTDAVEAAIGAPDRFLLLCTNTLRNRRLLAPAGMSTVAAGMRELVRLQAEGRAYIRA